MKALWDEFGQFWLAVVGAIAAQYLLTDEAMTRKQTAAAVVCGVFSAWFGTWPIVEHYALSDQNIPLVAGLLALTGRQLMAIAIKRIPELFNFIFTLIKNRMKGSGDTAGDILDILAKKRLEKKKGGDDEEK